MTKRRAPLSIDAALARIAGQLPGGYEAMGELVQRKDRTGRNWGDPDTPEQIPLDCAIVLDLAYEEAGGEGYPLHEAYTAKLELALVRIQVLHPQLGRVRVRRVGADRQAAVRELSENFEVIKAVLPLISAPEPHATGPPRAH